MPELRLRGKNDIFTKIMMAQQYTLDGVHKGLYKTALKHNYLNILTDIEISTGCVYSTLKKAEELTWNPCKSPEIHQWKCGHRIFVAALIEYTIYRTEHPSDINKVSGKLYNIMKKTLEEVCLDCPLCPMIEEDSPAALFHWFRLPTNLGTLIEMPHVDKDIVNSDTRSDVPYIFDIEGYRGTGLYIIGPDGIEKADVDEYYPRWDLRKSNNTLEVISGGTEIAGSWDSIIINDDIQIFDVDDDGLFVATSIDTELQQVFWPLSTSSNEVTLPYNHFSTKFLTHHSRITIVFTDDKNLVIDCREKTLILYQGDQSYDLTDTA